MSDMFPSLSGEDVLAFQFSTWYPQFKHISMKSTIIRPLGEDFKNYLLSDGVRIPDGSDNVENLISSGQDGDSDVSDEAVEPEEHFAFPELDAQIRKTIVEYDAVFPKLNFSSPKDASWILPSSSPLKCTSPMEVYILLKSSDFITHDVSPESVFDGCLPEARTVPYELELVLRKWYHVDPSREFRCFVRSGKLIAFSQRDNNFYDFMNEHQTREKLMSTMKTIWSREIKDKWRTVDYTFDLILTRDLASAHIMDFNPYASRTDPLLFTYDELLEIHRRSPSTPVLKTIDSRSHIAASRNAPTNVHNMVPFELLTLSSGHTFDDFSENLAE
ncbi:D123-domain-containing protein [Phellopilus nigrolimitatus]|nr:D123-domain-containing protein [Phellopilus nigrolimitatus]